MMPGGELAPGFADPVHGAQTTFRNILEAMSRPGSVVETAGIASAPEPLSPTMAAAALTLLDHETPLHLCPPFENEAAAAFLAFHCGSPKSDLTGAAFVLCEAGGLPDFDRLSIGTADYPDRSATLIVGVGAFGTGEEVTLSGPGIETANTFSASGLNGAFWTAARRNHARYPLGLDFIFCGPGGIAALPRSTSIAV